MRKTICIIAAILCCVFLPFTVNAENIDIPEDFEYKTTEDGSCILTGYKGTGEMIIPDGVTEIGRSAFEDRTDIIKVVIPSSVKIIRNRAFDGCENLIEVKFSDGLETICEEAFAYTGIESVIIPDSVTSIESAAFHRCDCKEVNLPDGLTVITESCFEYCTFLEDITFPSKLKKLEDRAFMDCSGAKIVLPEGVTYLGKLSLARVTNIHFPTTITYFADYFMGPPNDLREYRLTTPKYNPAYVVHLGKYGEITYTEQTQEQFMEAVSECYKKKAFIDMSFDGIYEILVLKDNGYGTAYSVSSNSHEKMYVYGDSFKDEIFFGEYDRKLYHLKDKDGREFYFVAAFREDRNYPVKFYTIEYTGYNLRCIDIGGQQLEIYDEKDGKLYFQTVQTIGGRYTMEYDSCTEDKLYEKLKTYADAVVKEYISGFELIAEYNLEPFFDEENPPESLYLGKDKIEVKEYTANEIDYIEIHGKLYYPTENAVSVTLIADGDVVDFEELEKLNDLTSLEIYTNQNTSLAGIEKLEKLCELQLHTCYEGSFTDTESVAKLKNLSVVTLDGDFENIDFLSKCSNLSCIRLFLEAEQDNSYYEPLGKLKNLKLVVLGRSSLDGTVNFSDENVKFISEETEAFLQKHKWDQAVEKAGAETVKSTGYDVELPWASDRIQYSDGVSITVCGQDILYGEPVEGITFEDDILTLNNVEIGTRKEHIGINIEGIDSIKIKLIGENKFNIATAAIRAGNSVTFFGDGSLYSTNKLCTTIDSFNEMYLTFEDRVSVTETKESAYKSVTVNGNASMNSTTIRLGELILCESGTFTAEHCAARNIKLNDNGVLTVTGNPNDNDNYLGAAIRNVNTFYINDNSRAVVSNYHGATIDFYDNNSELIVSNNGILEIKGNVNSEAISHSYYSNEKIVMNGNAVVKITNALVGYYGYNFIINGGSFSCETVEGGVPLLLEKKGFKINGEVISQSYDEYWLIPYEDTNCYSIYADGEFVESFSISVKQAEKTTDN